MGKREDYDNLSRREREVMFAVHRLAEVTAESLQQEMEEGFSYSAARRYLAILHEKGFLMMRKDGVRYFYRPVSDTREVGLDLLRSAFRNFFRGSATLGMASFLKEQDDTVTDKTLEELERLLRDSGDRPDGPEKP